MPNDEARTPVTPQELRYAAGLLETYEHYALAQKLNAAADQLERNAEVQWQPIETAPKDGQDEQVSRRSRGYSLCRMADRTLEKTMMGEGPREGKS